MFIYTIHIDFQSMIYVIYHSSEVYMYYINILTRRFLKDMTLKHLLLTVTEQFNKVLHIFNYN